MEVLVIDVGGTRVKLSASGAAETRRFPSGTTLTPENLDPAKHGKSLGRENT